MLLTGLRQISSPNKAQSGFVSNEYVPIVVVKALKITSKQVQKRWTQLLEMASLVRNNAVESSNNCINHSMAA
jgi:hypothetical protein